MKLLRKLTKIILLFSLITGFSQTLTAYANGPDQTPVHNDLAWTDLTFKGSKLLTTITVKIQISPGDQSPDTPSNKTGTDLAGCSETDDDNRLLTVKSSSKGLALQGQYEEKIWFKEPNGLPHKRIRVRNDDNPWVKSYCWEKMGVRRYKIKPGNSSENKQPPPKWTDRKEHFYEYPKGSAGCSSIFDPSLLFYMLSTLDPDMQQYPKEICVFGKKQLHRLTIQQVKSSPIDVSFNIQTTSQKKKTIKEQITPLVYSIKTESLATGKQEPENFSLLGLHKDIRIYMDPQKLIPVRISGTNNSAGKLDMDLQSARLK